jgi:drug/metabolite transporter (DMT)-like permease
VTALLLLSLSALVHAWWNYLVKRSGTADVLFVWLYSALMAPVALVLLLVVGPGPAWWAALVSTTLHTGYALALQRAYAAADLTVVYPVSRGAAPVLVLALSTPVIGAPSPAELAGIALVVAGLFVMSGPFRAGAGSARAVVGGLVVAGFTTAYTLWDAYAVSRLDVELLPYLAVSALAQAALMSAVALPRRTRIPAMVRTHGRTALAVTLLVPAAYGLVLIALSLASPAVVAAGRALNVVFATLLGLWLLREPRTPRTVGGTTVIVAGALALAAGA